MDKINIVLAKLRNSIESCLSSLCIVQYLHKEINSNNELYNKCRGDQFLIGTDLAHKINVYVSLGKIYDKGRATQSLHKLIKWVCDNKRLFSKESLRERIINMPDVKQNLASKIYEEKNIDDQIQQCYGFSENDFIKLREFENALHNIYKRSGIRELRNKVIAHNDNRISRSILTHYLKDTKTKILKNWLMGQMEYMMI